MQITFEAIGTIKSPFKRIDDMPIQPSGAADVIGEVILKPELSRGLDDVAGFSHLILIYCLHRSRGFELKVKPFLDDRRRGIFATRAPRRPNPIGLSVVKLIARENNRLTVAGLDVLDQTPVLDIKPYVPDFDAVDKPVIGWLTDRRHLAASKRSDTRFKNK